MVAHTGRSFQEDACLFSELFKISRSPLNPFQKISGPPLPTRILSRWPVVYLHFPFFSTSISFYIYLIQFTGHALMQIPQSSHLSLTIALSSSFSDSAQTGHSCTHPPHPVQSSVPIVTILFLLFWCCLIRTSFKPLL